MCLILDATPDPLTTAGEFGAHVACLTSVSFRLQLSSLQEREAKLRQEETEASAVIEELRGRLEAAERRKREGGH